MIHNKIFTIAIVGMALIGASFAAPVRAQDAAQAPTVLPLNIRVVDVDGIRTKSTAFVAAREQIAAYANANNQALQKEDKALRDANAELNRKRTILAPEVFAEERKKFEQSVAAFQRKTQEQQKAMNKLQLDVIGQLNNKIIQIITDYAQANKVSLILPIQSVVLRADTLDMDAHVLERLNKELPSVTVSLPTK